MNYSSLKYRKQYFAPNKVNITQNKEGEEIHRKGHLYTESLFGVASPGSSLVLPSFYVVRFTGESARISEPFNPSKVSCVVTSSPKLNCKFPLQSKKKLNYFNNYSFLKIISE